MFHVKRLTRNRMVKGITVLLFLFFIGSGCIGARATIQIPDYVLVPNGKENLGGENLTAFVFENNIKNTIQIEEFIANKYNTANYAEDELWVTIEKDKYKIIVYDNADFEKYINSANYSPINEEPKNDKYYSNRKFIAISMINYYNEDCLSDKSLFQNVAVHFLKSLKDEYVNQ